MFLEIKEREKSMWEAAKNRDAEVFLEIVDRGAVMVCGGARLTGAEYAQIIKEFDVAEYEMTGFETIMVSETVCQTHYLISITVAEEKNSDLAGRFHVTSTWKRISGNWRLIFNMDSRISTYSGR